MTINKLTEKEVLGAESCVSLQPAVTKLTENSRIRRLQSSYPLVCTFWLSQLSLCFRGHLYTWLSSSSGVPGTSGSPQRAKDHCQPPEWWLTLHSIGSLVRSSLSRCSPCPREGREGLSSARLLKVCRRGSTGVGGLQA